MTRGTWRVWMMASVALVCALGIGAPAWGQDEQRQDDAACVSDCDCPMGELCSPKTGTCELVACTREFKPVCGLDGKTYSNACEAKAAHVVVARQGECEDEAGDGDAEEDDPGEEDQGQDEGEEGDGAQVCGGIQGLTCADGQVCDMPCGADRTGVCVDRPEVCPEVEDPVCGCDGKTYGNDCKRLRAGMSKDHDGPCGTLEEPGAVFGCEDDGDCVRAAYCRFPAGRCEGRGSCEPRPEICTEEFDPVCGCDGDTYPNACNAAAAGVSVASRGECGS